jgi:P4 family phage/plasmid primase-like protien
MANIDEQDNSQIKDYGTYRIETDQYYIPFGECYGDYLYEDDHESFEEYEARIDSYFGKTKKSRSEIPIEELTDFALEELFFDRQKLFYSDGHFYRIVRYHLELIDKDKLEALILHVLRNEFRRIGKKSRIKAVADLIRMKWPDEFPSINFNKRLVAFSDCIIDIDSLFSPGRNNEYFLAPPFYTNCMHELRLNINPQSLGEYLPYGPNSFFHFHDPRPAVLHKIISGSELPFPESLSIYNDSLRSDPIVKYDNGQVRYEYSDEVEFHYGLIDKIKTCLTPTADKFFMDIADGDLNIVERIYQMIGYILIPGNEAKAYFLLQGESDSGKSVLGKFLEGYFPPELVTSLDISRLGEQYLPKEFATSCLNLSMDLPNGKMSAKSAATLKMLTGDDLITHEVKYKDAKPYRCRCKFVFSTNFPLEMTVYDEAFLNRTVCIPFTKTIPKEKQDAQLLSKLNAERPAITTKAILLYYFLKENKFKFSGADKIKPKVNYRMDINETIKAFIDTKCSITYNNEDYVSTRDLYNAYIEFCNDSGITYNGNMNGFSQRVHNLCYPHIESDRKRENNEHIRGYKGIKVCTKPYVVSKESEE